MNKLKISLNVEYKNGPWGGGNLFIANLTDFLESKGHVVIFDLFDSDIDIILIIDPRMLSESVMYSVKDIFISLVPKTIKKGSREVSFGKRRSNSHNHLILHFSACADL